MFCKLQRQVEAVAKQKECLLVIEINRFHNLRLATGIAVVCRLWTTYFASFARSHSVVVSGSFVTAYFARHKTFCAWCAAVRICGDIVLLWNKTNFIYNRSLLWKTFIIFYILWMLLWYKHKIGYSTFVSV